MSLSYFGFRKGWVYEGIISSENEDDSTNNAPMGFFTSDLKTITLRPYKNTNTYKNVVRTKTCDLHMPEINEKNIRLFYNFIWNKRTKTRKLSKNSSGYLILKVERVESDARNNARSVIVCSIERVVGKVFLFSRAPFLAFECVVKASKLGFGLEQDAFLREIIKNNFETIKRIAPNSEYEKIAKKCAEL